MKDHSFEGDTDMVQLCRYKFIGAALLLGLLTMFSASASAISFQVVQHDSCQDKIRLSSYVMETVFFDYFFDSGYIATNIPTVHSYSEAEDEDIFYRALEDTKTGFCKYLIMIVIEYDDSNSKNSDAILLSNIKKVDWLVYDALSESLLDKGERVVGTVSDKSDNVGGVKDLAKKLATDINSAVSKR